MIKGFPIEFIQKTLTQVLLEEHNKDNKYFGGDNQISIASFYEQLKTQEEVDRFTEVCSDLVNQQNKTQLIGNGIIKLPDNPTYTNLYSAMIIPMTWSCSIRTQIKNRDQMIFTINNLTDKLKGRKVDIAQLDVIDENERHIGVPFVVGTIGQHNEEMPELKNGDFVGVANSSADIRDVLLSNLTDKGIKIDYKKLNYLYCENNGILKVCSISKSGTLPYVGINDDAVLVDGKTIEVTGSAGFHLNEGRIYEIECDILIYDEDDHYETVKSYGEIFDIDHDAPTHTNFKVRFKLENDIQSYVENYSYFELSSTNFYGVSFDFIEDDGTYSDIIFPPEHEGFERYKLSLSFDSIKCNEPRSLNGNGYCDIIFGGSATLVNENVALGNDLVKVGIKRKKIVAETPITYNDEYTWLEPLEMPSGNNPSTQPLQLLSNKMLSNTQTDSVSVSIQYSFIADMGLELLKNWFKYARYGRINTNNISPNIIYDVVEYWSSWGIVEAETYLGKIADNVEIDNTESDTLTLAISMQVQGENN